MTDIDMESYGEPNDIGPDDPAPREPEGPPDTVTDEFEVWQFDAEASETVPDSYVVDRNPDPLDFRMWVFVGHGERSEFVMRASHRYSEADAVGGAPDDCCEVLFDGDSLRGYHCPAEVESLVERLTDAPVLTGGEPEASDHGGPIDY